MSVTTQAPVVLEPASQDFVEATAKPPFLYELTPAEARKVLDDVQAAPIDKLAVKERWITVPAEVGDVRVRLVRDLAAGTEAAVVFVERLRAAGVPVTTVRYDGITRDFMMLNPLSNTHATRAAIAQATATLRKALQGA